MNTPPSDTLALYDSRDALIGLIRLSPSEADPSHGDCIFDVEPLAGDAPHEARWLAKRRFKRSGEHKYALGPGGELTVRQAGFVLELVPGEEDGLQTVPPAPPVTAFWDLHEG